VISAILERGYIFVSQGLQGGGHQLDGFIKRNRLSYFREERNESVILMDLVEPSSCFLKS